MSKSIETEISDLASHVASQAAKTGEGAPSFDEKVEALKVLTTYYATIKKRGTPQESDEDPQSFEALARGIKQVA